MNKSVASSGKIADWLRRAEVQSPWKVGAGMIAVATAMAVAHYTFGDWVFNPGIQLWKERAFWSEMWPYIFLPFGMWLAWSAVSLARVKPARFILALMVILIGGDAIFHVIPIILKSVDRLHLGLFKSRVENWHWGRYWDWWPLWMPTVLTIGNFILLQRWWLECGSTFLRDKSTDQVQSGRARAILKTSAIIGLYAACVVTAFHLGLPRLPSNGDIVWLARSAMIRPHLKNDFDHLIRQSLSAGQPLAALLTHLELADLQRRQFYSNLDDSTFQQYMLSPQIDRLPLEELNWRRTLWEEFYPRVRRESDPVEAARIVVRLLRERVGIDSNYDYRVGVETILTQRMTDETGFERIYVAALRSVGVAARLGESGHAELLHGDIWRAAPRPVLASFLPKTFPVPEGGLVNFRNWASDDWPRGGP